MGNWVIKYSHNPLKVKKLNGHQIHSSWLLALPSIINIKSWDFQRLPAGRSGKGKKSIKPSFPGLKHMQKAENVGFKPFMMVAIFQEGYYSHLLSSSSGDFLDFTTSYPKSPLWG